MNAVRRGASPSVEDDALAAILARVRAGDSLATRQLISAVAPTVLLVVRRVLGPSHPDTEDLSQECLVGFIHALKNFRGECTVRHYARRVALWRALEDQKTRRALKRAVNIDPNFEVETLRSEGEPDQTTLNARRAELLQELLHELPQPQAEALALRHLLEYSVEQIAEATAVSTNTVRSRLRLAKQALHRKITERSHFSELDIRKP